MRGLWRMLAGFGRAVVPLGLFSVFAVGLHAGADRVDDYALVAFNSIDAVIDEHGGALVRWVFEALGFTAATVERWTFGFVDLVDMETKDWAARGVALALELIGDVWLAAPLLRYRAVGKSWTDRARALRATPSVLWVVAPLAAGLASLAGVLTIARELSVAGQAGIADVGGPARAAELGAAAVAFVVLSLVVWRLGLQVVLRSLTWAERAGAKDAARQVSLRRRRLRGWGLGLVVLPVAVLAVVEAVPLISTLRALFSVG